MDSRGQLLLIEAVRKEERIKTAGLFIALLIALFLFLYSLDQAIIFIIISLFSISLLSAFIMRSFKKTLDNDFPLLHILRHDAYSIVWVYSVKTERMPFGILIAKNLTLILKTVDRETFSLKISEEESEVINKYLNRKLPHATFGFDNDKDQWYEANPELLYRQ